jgi:uncharacterized membrane protein (GlpM family)
MPARALGFASGLTIPGNIDLTQFVGSINGNITAANTSISSLRANVTATNSAIITANVGMKTYVDTGLASALIAASSYGNSVVQAYLPVNPTINAIQSNITAANSEVTALRANITAANVNLAIASAFYTYANTKIGTNNNSNLVVVSATISTSVTTGALVVAGGVGVAGNVVATGVVGTYYGAGTGLTGTASALTVGVAGVVTGVTSANVTTALGFTPYNSTNPNSYISASSNASTQVSSLGVGTAASGLGGEIRATNNITAYYSSDERFKENIRPIPDALQKVVQIGGKLYDWTDKYIAEHGGEDGYFVRKSDFGVVAQHLLSAGFPEGVRTRPDGSLAVDYEKLSALAFQAIADLYEQVQQLKGK